MQPTPNWFQYAQHNFETHLAHIPTDAELDILQIGAYTGDASVWFTDRFPDARLTDVDTWEGSDEPDHHNLDWRSVWSIYRTRLAGRNVTPWRMTSDQYFYFAQPHQEFDIVYVDGDHTREQVARDAENAWNALKPGGILIFDDYTWRGHEPGNNPMDAINPFLVAHNEEFVIVTLNTQAWIRRDEPAQVGISLDFRPRKQNHTDPDVADLEQPAAPAPN